MGQSPFPRASLLCRANDRTASAISAVGHDAFFAVDERLFRGRDGAGSLCQPDSHYKWACGRVVVVPGHVGKASASAVPLETKKKSE